MVCVCANQKALKLHCSHTQGVALKDSSERKSSQWAELQAITLGFLICKVKWPEVRIHIDSWVVAKKWFIWLVNGWQKRW